MEAPFSWGSGDRRIRKRNIYYNAGDWSEVNVSTVNVDGAGEGGDALFYTSGQNGCSHLVTLSVDRK